MKKNMRSYACSVLLFFLVVLVIFGSGIQASEPTLKLDHASIVTGAEQPSFVQYAMEDLVAYIKESTGNEILVVRTPPSEKGVRILVGEKIVQEIFPEHAFTKDLGKEGYILKTASVDNVDYLIATGATPRGTKLALGVLMKALQFEGKTVFVPASLQLTGKPAFAKRGMHFNGWAISPPYSFRTWSEKEWKQYIDILAYQGVNLFYIWPFMEIIPLPLSAEDQEYLEECRRVVDYAQKKHGMEVWIMQCTNRVAEDRCGVENPRSRPYWRSSQRDLDPKNPKDFEAIMASREAMYKNIDNVDGVCNIDSDPGNSPAGCTLDDYIKVLCGCRELLDRYNIHGKKTKLIHWMWFGWARPENVSFAQHQIPTIQALKKGLPEPWELICGKYEFLPVCHEEGVTQKAMLLPYGEIEGEPAYPHTNVEPDRIRVAFNDIILKNPELAGVMGNVQTPLLQFPHVFFYTSILSDPNYRERTDKEMLLDLSNHLYPEHAQLLADCYLALKESDPNKVEDLANRLDRIVRENRLGRLGIFGRKLFPDHRIVAESLILQLKLHAAKERFISCVTPTIQKEKCEELIYNYCAAYLAWEAAHGWHERKVGNWREWPLGASPWDTNNIERLYPAAGNMYKIFGSNSEVDVCLSHVVKKLSANYDVEAVQDGCIIPFKNIFQESQPIDSLAQKAVATASVEPDSKRYPISAANDGLLRTQYWPGGELKNNVEWLQLTWDKPTTFSKVVISFVNHSSMPGRTIHLQKEVAPDQWEDFATTVVTEQPSSKCAVVTFNFPSSVTLSKIRIVNLIDVYEIEIQ